MSSPFALTPATEAYLQEQQAVAPVDQQAAQQDTAQQFKRQLDAQAQAQKQIQADAARMQREQLAAAKRAGVKTTVNPAGQEEMVRHEDGAPVFESGFQGEPVKEGDKHIVPYRDPRGRTYQVPTQAIRSAKDPAGQETYEFDIPKADGGTETVRQPVGTKPLWSVDPLTGKRYTQAINPETGSAEPVEIGIDPTAAAKAAYERRKLEFDQQKLQRAQQHDELAARQNQQETYLKPWKEKMAEAEKALIPFTKPKRGTPTYKQTADGIVKVTDYGAGTPPLEQPVSTTDTAELSAAKNWLESHARAKTALETARASHDPLAAQIQQIQEDRDKLALQTLAQATAQQKELSRMERAQKAGIPVYEPDWQQRVLAAKDDPRIQQIFTQADLEDMGHPLAQDTARVALPETTRLFNRALDGMRGLQEVTQPQTTAPVSGGAGGVPMQRPVGQDDGEVPMARPPVNLVDQLTENLAADNLPTPGKDARALATEALGITDPESWMTQLNLSGRHNLIKDGQIVAEVDTKKNRLLIPPTSADTVDAMQQRLANTSKNSLPIYYGTGETEPYNAQQVRDLITTGIDISRTTTDPLEQEQKLEKAGLSPQALHQQFMDGKLSAQDARLLNQTFHGIKDVDTSKPAAIAGFPKWLENSQIDAAQFRKGDDAAKRDVINRYFDHLASVSNENIVRGSRHQLAEARSEMLKPYAGPNFLGSGMGAGQMAKQTVVQMLPLIGRGIYDLTGLSTAASWMGLDTEADRLAWEQASNENKRRSNFLHRMSSADGVKVSMNGLKEWADTADSADDLPDEIDNQIKEAYYNRYHQLDPEAAAKLGTTKDTFSVKKDPVLKGLVQRYLTTADPTTWDSLHSLLAMDAADRETQKKLMRYSERPQVVSAEDVVQRAKGLDLDLTPEKAGSIMALGKELSSTQDARKASNIFKQAAGVLGLKPQDAALALSLLTTEENADPNSISSLLRSGWASSTNEAAIEVASTAAEVGIGMLLAPPTAGGSLAVAATERGARMGLKTLARATYRRTIGAGLEAMTERSALFAAARSQFAVGRNALSNAATKAGKAFAKAGIATPSFGSPLTKGQKLRNFAVTAGKTALAAAPQEAVEEMISETGSTEPTAESFGKAAAGGAYGALILSPIFAGIGAARNARASRAMTAAFGQERQKWADSLNQSMSGTPGFKPYTADDYDLISGIAANPATTAAKQQYAAAKAEFEAATEEQSAAQAEMRDAAAGNAVSALPDSPRLLAAQAAIKDASDHLGELATTTMMAANDLRALPEDQRQLYTALAKAASGASEYTAEEARSLMGLSGDNAVAFQQAQALPAEVAGPPQVTTSKTPPTVSPTVPGRYVLPEGVRLSVPPQALALLNERAPSLHLLVGNDQSRAVAATQAQPAPTQGVQAPAEVAPPAAQQSATPAEAAPVAPQVVPAHLKPLENIARQALGAVTARSPRLRELMVEAPENNTHPTGGMWLDEQDRLAFHLPTLVQQLEGLSPQQAAQRVIALADEEISHAANMNAARRLYKRPGTNPLGLSFEDWREAHYGDIWQNQFTPEMRQKVEEAYGETLPEQAWIRAMEGLRMLDQLRRTGSITESVLQALDAILQALREFLSLVSEGGRKIVQQELDAIAAVLEEFGYESGKVNPTKAKTQASQPTVKESLTVEAPANSVTVSTEAPAETTPETPASSTPSTSTAPAVGDLAEYEGYRGRVIQDGQRMALQQPDGTVVEVTDPAALQPLTDPEARKALALQEISQQPLPDVRESTFTGTIHNGAPAIQDQTGRVFVPQNRRLLKSIRQTAQGIQVLVQAVDQPGRIIRLTGEQAQNAQEALLESAQQIESSGGKVKWGNQVPLASAPRVVTPEQDAEYMQAVQSGDVAKQQAMVDEAAKARGYSTGPVYHGSKQFGFDSFDRRKLGSNTSAGSAYLGFFFAGKKETAMSKSYVDLQRKSSDIGDPVEYANSELARIGKELVESGVLTESKRYREFGSSEDGYMSDTSELSAADDLISNIEGIAASVESEITDQIWEAEPDLSAAEAVEKAENHPMVLRLKNLISILEDYSPESELKEGSGVYRTLLKMTNPFVVDQKGARYREQSYRSLLEQAAANNNDGVVIKNTYDGGPLDDIYVAIEPSQIKSADPVTYDANGQVIPLSQRFNPASDSILYSAPRQTYRSPTSALETTARALRGESPAPPARGLTRLFNPEAQERRPATGERGLFDMPQTAPSVPTAQIVQAYTQAAQGQSSAWQPIRRVFERAQAAQPDLTPEAFMRTLNALNESGRVFISPVERVETVQAAQPFVVGAAGVEMTFPPETLQAQAIKTNLERVRAVRPLNEREQQAYDQAQEVLAAVPVETRPPVTHTFPDGYALTAPGMHILPSAPIRAYHGTPHKVDRFSMDKIGTGEGAQAYGWGLYFAENKDVARGYQSRIAGADWVDKNNRPMSSLEIGEEVYNQARKDGFSVKDADELRSYWSHYAQQGGMAGTRGIKSIKAVIDGKGIRLKQRGSLYTVDLLPDEEEFLDWDKPLNDVAAKKISTPNIWALIDPDGYGFTKQIAGHRVYQILAQKLGPKEASQLLANSGIPGIRYLDGNSRADGQGTRNYVIFDDKLVRILEENGRPVERPVLASAPVPSKNNEMPLIKQQNTYAVQKRAKLKKAMRDYLADRFADSENVPVGNIDSKSLSSENPTSEPVNNTTDLQLIDLAKGMVPVVKNRFGDGIYLSTLKIAIEKAEKGQGVEYLKSRIDRVRELIDELNKKQDQENEDRDKKAYHLLKQFPTQRDLDKEIKRTTEERTKYTSTKLGKIGSFGGTWDPAGGLSDRITLLMRAKDLLSENTFSGDDNILASGPAPQSSRAAEILASFPPVWREVLALSMSGQTIPQIVATRAAQNRPLSETAVANILVQAAGRFKILMGQPPKPTVQVQNGIVKAATGRPDLAGSGSSLMAALDQNRPMPEVVHQAEMRDLAATLFGGWPAESLSLTRRWMDSGGMLSPPTGLPYGMQAILDEASARGALPMLMQAAANHALNEARLNNAPLHEQARLGLAQRELGTQQARAFGMRQDTLHDPLERHALYVQKMLVAPTDSELAALKNNPGMRDRILAGIERRAQDLKNNLKAQGFDIDAWFAEQRSLKAEEESFVPPQARQPLQRLSPAQQAGIKAILSGTSLGEAAMQAGLSLDELRRAYNDLRQSLHEAAAQAAVAAKEAALRSAPAGPVDYATLAGLPPLPENAGADFKLTDTPKTRAYQVRREKTPLAQPDVVAGAISEMAAGQAGYVGKMAEFYTMSLLTGPQTWVVNGLSGFSFGLYKNFIQRLGSAGIASLIRATGMADLPDAPALSDIGPVLKHAFASFIPAAKNAFRSWRHNRRLFDLYAQGLLSMDPGSKDWNFNKSGIVIDGKESLMKGEHFKPRLSRSKWYKPGTVMDAFSFRMLLLADELVRSWFGRIEMAVQMRQLARTEPRLKARTEELKKQAQAALPKGFELRYSPQTGRYYAIHNVQREFVVEHPDGSRTAEMRTITERASNEDWDRLPAALRESLAINGQDLQLHGGLSSLLGANATPAQLEARMKQLSKPGGGAWLKAMEAADTLTAQTPLGEGSRLIDKLDGLADWLNKGKQSKHSIVSVPLSLIFPFVSTPVNLFKNAVGLTPVGGLLSIMDAVRAHNRAKTGDIEGARKIMNASRALEDIVNQTVAWSLVVMLSHLIHPEDDEEKKLPWITGTASYPKVKEGNREILNRVAPPSSIRIGDRWYSYNKFDPFATALSSLVDSIHSFEKKPAPEAALDVVFAGYDAMQDKTFLAGLPDILKLIDNPRKNVAEWATKIATGFVPNIIRQPLRAADDVARDSSIPKDRSLLENLELRASHSVVPQSAMPKVDVWGRPATRDTAMWGPATDFAARLLSPMATQKREIDPLDVALYTYNMDAEKPFEVTAPDREIKKTLGGKPVKISLTDAEYQDFAMKSGQAARQAIGSAYNDRKLTEEDVKTIKEIVSAAQSQQREIAFARAYAARQQAGKVK